MADQGLWFKLWCSAFDDPHLSNLSNADFGIWAKLGAFIKRHGSHGEVTIPAPATGLCALFQVPNLDALEAGFMRLPHVQMRREIDPVSSETTLIVSLHNWRKYQDDFSTPRVRRFREMKRSRREEKRRDENEKRTTPIVPIATSNGISPAWGTPEALVELYNASSADECPAVTKITPARRQKAKAYLAMFPERTFWEEVFAESKRSPFLRGLKRGPGHEHFVASLDWLLTKGKDGTENCVKVSEGRYRDG